MPRFTMPRLQTLSKPKFLNGIPNNSIFAIATLIAVNALVWIAAGIVLHFHPRLISPAALSYVLGLRHALDADHIAAIDLMTRRLIASGQRPATVGTFFSLGHSTIVIVTCIVVAATSGALRERFDGFQHVGNIVGTSLILIFPILFTAGMCMLDTTDGALMTALYTSKAFSRDVVAILYYSIVLTGITVVVSAFIGIVQVLSLIQNVADPQGRFWDGVSSIGDHFDIVGGSICGVFLVVGLGSIFVYKPWRRHVERQQQSSIQDPEPSLDAQSPAPSTEREDDGFVQVQRII
ncbi:hypothetical protein H9Q69_000800 [Fusarium xylarioides]|nr:hypothetical protein H9Q69_000800 [Fusarium xylarioides]